MCAAEGDRDEVVHGHVRPLYVLAADVTSASVAGVDGGGVDRGDKLPPNTGAMAVGLLAPLLRMRTPPSDRVGSLFFLMRGTVGASLLAVCGTVGGVIDQPLFAVGSVVGGTVCACFFGVFV